MVALSQLLLPLTGALALASQAVLIRVATRRSRVSSVLLVVLLVNVALLIPIAAVVGYPQYGITGRSVLAFMAAGIVGTVLGRVALFTGIQRVGAARAEPLKASSPLFAAIGAVLVLGEQMVTQHLVGIVLIVIGIGLISWEQARGPDVAALGSVTDLIFPLLAAVLFAIEPIFAKIGLNEGTPFVVGLAIKTTAALLGFVGYLRWHDVVPGLGEILEGDLSWYILAGLANTVFVIALYAALTIAPVVVVMPIIQASPLFVVVLSYLFLQQIERVTPRLAMGVAVVVSGGVLVAIYG